MVWKHNTGEGIRIAVIDSGADVNCKELRDADIVPIGGDISDSIGHGTAVASIIHKQVPRAQLFIIRLFGENGEIDAENLVEILEEIADYDLADIVHLSSGAVQCEVIDDLQAVCQRLNDQGILLVSAFDNGGAISFPAAFDTVIGVDWYEKCARGTQYIFVENSPVNILGMGSLQRLPWTNGTYRYVGGSSFAAPYITAAIAKIIQKNKIEKNKVMQELKQSAWRCITATKQRRLPRPNLPIQKAIVSPFNKEIHSLFRFSDMLNFMISGVYESPLFRRVGKNTNELLGLPKGGVTILSEQAIDWTSDFDTVILGHTDTMSSALGRDIAAEYLKLCIEYGKNLYSFDDLSGHMSLCDRLTEQGNFAYVPWVCSNEIPRANFGKLYGIPCPVLGVFGTSPKQGKFTLQLSLRRAFQAAGYRVGQLGTEPTALLFGMDHVFPMGYEGRVEVAGADAIAIINAYLWDIVQGHPDVILVGSQSHTIPHNTGNLGLYPVAQHEFLLGTEPDACILCVNPYDEQDYVERTIAYLHAYLDTKVIALSLFPAHRELEWAVQGGAVSSLNALELEACKQYYETQFGIPCYILGSEEDFSSLFDCVINCFTEEAVQ